MSGAQELEPVVEAVLFVASEPVSRDRLLEVFDPRQREAAEEAIDAVIARYAEAPERGFMIDEVAGGFRLVSRPDLHGYLRRFFEISGANKLSMAALETLAIIAYRQPATGPEIQELRGVSSSGVLKTLLERRLVRIAGRKEVVGKPFLYATTREFLMHFGLRSLKELPPLEEFEELYASEANELDAGPDHEEIVLKEAAALDEAAEEEEDRRAEHEEAVESAERDLALDGEGQMAEAYTVDAEPESEDETAPDDDASHADGSDADEEAALEDSEADEGLGEATDDESADADDLMADDDAEMDGVEMDGVGVPDPDDEYDDDLDEDDTMPDADPDRQEDA